MEDPRILILKTGEALPAVKDHHGDFEDWIARGLGQAVSSLAVVSAHLGEPLPAAASIEGVVVTGSPAMVTERPEWSEMSARWLARVIERDSLPVLGLCYGHQLMAHGLGGEVGSNPQGREMGTVDVTFPTECEVDGGLDPLFECGVFPGHMSHVESVLRPPEGARILARTALDPHSVLAFGPRQWGVQFHPEFDRDVMRGYIEVRRGILQDEGLDPDALMTGAEETDRLTRVLGRFADLVRPG